MSEKLPQNTLINISRIFQKKPQGFFENQQDIQEKTPGFANWGWFTSLKNVQKLGLL